MSSLRGQLLKIFVAKMREAFVVQKLLTFFQQKYWQISDINILNFNVTLTNDVVNFEQPGPELQIRRGNSDTSEIIFLSLNENICCDPLLKPSQ